MDILLTGLFSIVYCNSSCCSYSYSQHRYYHAKLDLFEYPVSNYHSNAHSHPNTLCYIDANINANTNFHSNQHANPRPNTDIYIYASTDFSAAYRKAAKAGITTADATDAAAHTTDARRISCNLEKLRGWGYTKFSELSSVTCAYSNYLSPQTFAGQFASNWK